MAHEKEPLKDLFDEVKKELDEARQDLEAARQQIRTQKLLTEKERDSLTELVTALSDRREKLMEALQEIKKDQEATEALRKSVEDTANEVSGAADAVLKEFEAARKALARRRQELELTLRRIRHVSTDLDSRRPALGDVATRLGQPILTCPSCGRNTGPTDRYCDACGARIA